MNLKVTFVETKLELSKLCWVTGLDEWINWGRNGNDGWGLAATLKYKSV
jgi:hypothetical protein